MAITYDHDGIFLAFAQTLTNLVSRARVVKQNYKDQRPPRKNGGLSKGYGNASAD